MLSPADLPQTIPLFPLQGALLLPRARLPLHIFEPRYLQMLEDCLKTPHRLIGMIQNRPVPSPLPGIPGVPGGGAGSGSASGSGGATPPRLNAIGCAGRLTAFSETEDGRYMITLTGISRFRLQQEAPGFTPYQRADVTWRGFERDLGRPETDPGFDRPGFLELLSRFFSDRELSTNWDTLKEAEDELLLNSLSMLLPFEAEEKQALLEAPTLTNRRETLVTLIEFALRGGDEERIQ